MHQPTNVRIPLILIVSIISANALDPLRTRLLERDTQLSCPTANFDILCAADSGITICHECLDICCQLHDGGTPYTCGGLENSHCCGTDKPACGADPTCKNAKGDRDVVSALDVVYPTAVTVSAVLSTTETKVNPFASGTGAALVRLATTMGEKNPNVTGGAGDLKRRIRKEGVLMILAAAMVLLLDAFDSR
jgi:hypothetical protein